MFVKEIEIVIISKEEVIKKDIRRLSRRIEKLRKGGFDSKGKLYVYFKGYDGNSKLGEVFEVPEIRAYVKKLYNKHPYFIYFINSTLGCDLILLSSLSKVSNVVRVGSKLIDIDIKIPDRIKSEIVYSVKKNCLYDGETLEGLEDKLNILNYIN